jgi:predicted deacylase
MIINGTEIKPGKNATVKIKVGDLPSGNSINLFAHVFRSKNPGPTLLVLGGVHGDEINGVEIVRRSVKSGLFKKLNVGAVIAVPLLNVYGFINFSRDLPDGKDVNRSFPGTSRGSLASRVAYAMSKHILPVVDLGLDFHTGGRSIHNYPQLRVNPADKKSLKLAKVFNPPFIIESKPIGGSLRKECTKRGIPMVVYEGGESLRIDKYSLEEGINGIKRVMFSEGMITEELPTQKTILVKNSKWIRASQAGLFIGYKVSGDHVEKGEVLGHITDPYGNKESKIKSPVSGVIYGHNNIPLLHLGEALYHIGFEDLDELEEE